jgi:hypothetical protein
MMGLQTYLALFLITCLLEAPVYWVGLHRQLSVAKTFWVIVLVNLATHPAVTWLFPRFFLQINSTNRDYLMVSEVSAILVEAFLLMIIFNVSKRRAMVVSFLANLFSWWSGLYVAYYLGF